MTLAISYPYDAAGNMTHDGSHSYTYDAENRLATVDAGATATLVYDAEGHGVKRVSVAAATNTFTTMTETLGGNSSTEASTAPISVRTETSLPEYSRGTTYFIHPDHLGSTRLVTAYPTPTVVECDDYYAYGEANVNVGTCLAATITTYKFTGLERDFETNLDHTWFRQNSSTLGRWMTSDPAGLAAVDPTTPQSWNGYAYVLDSPATLVDPLGLCGGGPGSVSSSVGGVAVGSTDFFSAPCTDVGNGGQVIGPKGDYPDRGGPKTPKTCMKPTGPSKIINGSLTTSVPTTALGALIGGLIGGPPGAALGGVIGNLVGVGVSGAYVPSTGSLYIGPTALVGLGGGTGGGLNYVNVSNTQNANSIANGLSFSLTYQPLPFAGATIIKSPGSGPPVVGPSIGSRIPVVGGVSFNFCVRNCGGC